MTHCNNFAVLKVFCFSIINKQICKRRKAKKVLVNDNFFIHNSVHKSLVEIKHALSQLFMLLVILSFMQFNYLRNSL